MQRSNFLATVPIFQRLTRATPPQWKNKARETDVFLPTLTKIFKFSKWFGIPTYGNKIYFIWATIILLLLFTIVVASIVKVIRSLAGLAQHDSDGRGVTARLSGAIFYTNGLLSQILSWRLIASWKRLSHHWLRVEITSLHLPQDQKIRRRVVIVTCFVAVCAMSEHMLSMMSATGFTIHPEEYFDRYMLSSHGFLFHTENYSLWKVIPTFIMSKLATVFWNFQDLIIILISMGLTSRYNRLNFYVKHIVAKSRRNRSKTDSDMFLHIQIWRKLREAYVKQSSLVRTFDRHLGPLVLLSNINNLYFICLQLFLGLNRGERGVVNRMYYFLSLSWLLFRACSVVLAAADVNLHSKRALMYLSQCPDTGYNLEVKRLKHQLTHDKVVLSGMGLFSLDRQNLLGVAGNIVKYEMVLFQYDKDN
ncbi:gustatory receptor for sugar taste 64a-like [Plodia interpunctella]|uniref:gustatory receptor for sugar taste 64a-like n=1 Tax=Plodia interpunctella TaxID=58824 RepID=UPI00236798FE|nr:gustatory receptor for sugar taste 64a-like [Plodia interpunctella]